MNQRECRQRLMSGGLSTAALLLFAAAGQAQTVFYTENFENAPINQVSGNRRLPGQCSNAQVWTKTHPTGWIANDCGVPTYTCRVGSASGCNPLPACRPTCGNNAGVREVEGWTFLNKAWWIGQQGDQRRSEFTNATGTVMVADGDFWDDFGSPAANCGLMNTFLSTRPIDLTGADLSSLTIGFDSSWRPESYHPPRNGNGPENQTAIIHAIYTVGGGETAVEVLHWDADDRAPDPNDPTIGQFYHGDNPNEHITLDATALVVPAGATSVRFEFAYLNAGNDWWWALDNIAVTANISGSPTALLTEDFEELQLGAPVTPNQTGRCAQYCTIPIYTHDNFDGITNVASILPPLNPDGTQPPNIPMSGGTPDYAGWSFTNVPFWNCLEGQNRNGFTNSSGIVAIADGDTWDDLAHPAGQLDTMFTTPAIDISGRSGDTLVLTFDNSWRPENPPNPTNQTAVITATFNTGATATVVNWQSDPVLPNYKAPALNELFATAFAVPQGATSVQLSFHYVGGNAFWWAVDNLSVFEGQVTLTVDSETPRQGFMALAPTVDYSPCFNPWAPTPPAGWTKGPVVPPNVGLVEARGWSFMQKDWWITQQNDQARSLYTSGRGFLAIADGDMWDDRPNGEALFSNTLSSPTIPLPANVTQASIAYDSSWRPEFGGTRNVYDANGQQILGAALETFANAQVPPLTIVRQNDGSAVAVIENQNASVTAVYTTSAGPVSVQLLHYQSIDTLPDFHADGTYINERVEIGTADLHIPAGATAVSFVWNYYNAGNSWWWAFDNVTVNVNNSVVLFENFENPQDQQPTITGPQPGPYLCSYFSTVAQQLNGFTVDNSGITGCDPTAAADYYGFNAWLTDAWIRNQGGSRAEFQPEGTNTSYVSDFSARGCDGVAYLVSPSFDIRLLNPASVQLAFDSGWFSEAGHRSTVEVSYDGGPWTVALDWNPSTKATNTNESVIVALNNPSGAQTMQYRMGDSNSGWWAVTNLVLTGTVGSPSCPADFNNDAVLNSDDLSDFITGYFNVPADPRTDFNSDGAINADDLGDFITAYFNGC